MMVDRCESDGSVIANTIVRRAWQCATERALALLAPADDAAGKRASDP
jgi:hypothetical protein